MLKNSAIPELGVEDSLNEIRPPLWVRVTDVILGILAIVVGVVIGFIGLIYAGLMIIAFGIPLGNISVFLGVFIGLGALVVSMILLGWGSFWRRKVDNRNIF